MLNFYKSARKAVHGAIVASLPVIAVVTADSSPGGGGITKAEWLAIAIAVFGVGTTVYSSTNEPQA